MTSDWGHPLDTFSREDWLDAVSLAALLLSDLYLVIRLMRRLR